jgi:UDP-N-acetyl-D-glucosamine dehydrogenase
MPAFVVSRVSDALNDRAKAVRGSRVLVCGIAYKKDIDDCRESPALDIIELLKRRGANVDYHDPHVPRFAHGDFKMEGVSLDDVESYDCVVVTTNHSKIDFIELTKRAQVLVDTRNATKGLRQDFKDKIVSL